MIAFLDVDYRDSGAVAAGVLAHDWSDPAPAAEIVSHISQVAEYVPGEFFRRELPCLLNVLDRCLMPPDLVVVDGYVWLGADRPGLGARLFEALGGRVPVVGVGKTCFLSAQAVSVSILRGGSKQPLWVTAIGVDPTLAAEAVRTMHGPHRLPTLLGRADRLARSATPVKPA